MAEDFDRLGELQSLLEELEETVAWHKNQVAYLDIESLFSKYIENDSGDFCRYLETKKGKKPGEKEVLVYSNAEAAQLAANVKSLSILDFEEIDTDQKSEVISYLEKIVSEESDLLNAFDINRALFVINAEFWISYLKNEVFADLLDDEIAYAFFQTGKLAAKIEIAENLGSENILCALHKQYSAKLRSKGHKERKENYNKAVSLAKESWQNGSNIDKKKMSLTIAHKVNSELYENLKKSFFNDKKKMEKEYNRQCISEKILSSYLIKVESEYKINGPKKNTKKQAKN